ncbi:MAG: hypothetical protein Q4B26_00310 [Eubacteriales bacterium]|nr:hypothetical protein [Eubacteriales bacterium]
MEMMISVGGVQKTIPAKQLANGKSLVSTRTIKRVLMEFGTQYTFHPLKLDQTHCVMQCDVTRFNGKELFLSCCGEAVVTTLWSREMKSMPATIAGLRGLSEAARILLDLEDILTEVELDIQQQKEKTNLHEERELSEVFTIEDIPVKSEKEKEKKEETEENFDSKELLRFGSYHGEPIEDLLASEKFVEYIRTLMAAGATFRSEELDRQFSYIGEQIDSQKEKS